MENVNGTYLQFYYDSELDQKAIISHVINFETGIPVSRLMSIL